MTTVTNYKTQGTNLSDICNTVNQDYYGDVTTGYKQATIDIGTVLCSSTFSSVPGSIVPSGYSASINQYNTGAVSWTKSTVPSITYGFASSVSDMSSTGQYAVYGISNNSTSAATIYYSSNYGVSWGIATGVTGNYNFSAITMSGTGQNCCMIKESSGPIYISSNYGATWSSSGSLSTTWSDISMSYTGQYAVACIDGSTTTGKIYKSNNYGSTWTDVVLPAGYLGVWISIAMSGSGLFAIAFSNQTGQIYLSNDYGNSWSPIISISNVIFSMSMSYSGQYAVFGIITTVGLDLVLYYSSNYGITWTLSASTISKYGNGLIVSMSNTGQYVLACAYGGSQLCSFLSKDYGQTYSQGTYSFPSSPNNIRISGNGIYAITSCINNGIYYTSNTSTIYTSMELTTVFEPLYKYDSWNPTNSILGYWVAISMSYTGQYVIALDYNNNRLYYSSDYGVTWNVSSSITSAHTYSALSISSSGQYGICSPNLNSGLFGIWYSSNYGATWTKSATASTTYWQGSSISSGGKYAIASTVGTTRSYYSSNYGVTWTINAVSVPPWRLSAISGNGYAIATEVVNGGGGGGIYYSTNNGQTWTLSNADITVWKSLTISSSGQYAIAGDWKYNGGIGGGYTGHIYISVNYGVDWTLTLTLLNINPYKLTTSYSGQYAIVIGLYDDGIIQLNISKYSNDFGNTWTDITNTPLNSYNNSISISGSGQYAVLCNSSFSSNLGYIYSCIATNKIITPSLIYNTWTVTPSSATGAWSSVSMSSTGQYAIGCISSGKIYYSNTYGQSWTISSSVTGIWSSVSMSNTGQYAVGCIYSGKIYYSNTYGQSWTVSSSATGTWTSVSISGNGQYAVGCIYSGQIYYSNTYGQSWTVASSVTGTWTSVSISGNGQYAIGCVNPGYIYYSNTYGQSWTIASSGLSSPWYSVSIAGNGQYAIACDNDGLNGYIYYSINYGQSWTVSSSPNNLWISVSISGNGQYAVGCASPGIIFYSNTYGQSWNVTTSATGTWYSVAISGSGQYGIACVNGGQIYYCKATQ